MALDCIVGPTIIDAHAIRIDREDHVWTDPSGLDSPRALLTSRIKTVAIDRHQSTGNHVLACVFSRKEAAEPPLIGPGYGCLARSRAYRNDSGQCRSACSICCCCVWGRVCVYLTVMPRPLPLLGLWPSVCWRMRGSTLASCSNVAKPCRHDFGQVAWRAPHERLQCSSSVRNCERSLGL